jgi:spoIIIJ-associated protein
MESLEISAKTEEEAVEIALEKLGAAPDEVEVVVLKKGKSGFLGLGGEEATVRVTMRPPEGTEEEDGVALAKEMLEKLLSLMKLSATVTEKQASEGEGPTVLDITGDDLGILIGRRGQTLLSLQHLVYLMVSHRLKSRIPVVIDVEGYRQRRQETLTTLALRIAESVEASGQPADLEPMPANERRVIHLALQDHEAVTTESVGEGESRKVTIKKR